MVLARATQTVDFKGAIQSGGTTIVDTSRNLTNIGTISSGAITSSGNVTVDQLTVASGNNIINTGNMTIDVAGDLTLDADGGDIIFIDGQWHAIIAVIHHIAISDRAFNTDPLPDSVRLI